METKTEAIAADEVEFQPTTAAPVWHAKTGQRVVRVAADVGIELTSTCAHDLQSADRGGMGFVFNSADIAGLKPRVKFLDILDKAEGMALASQLRERKRGGAGGDGGECKGDDGDGEVCDAATNVATRLRLLNQAASKLRVAARGVFPDQDVAIELVRVRLEQARLETSNDELPRVAGKAFEEIRMLGTWCNIKDAEIVQFAMDLADALLGNPVLNPEVGVRVLHDGLVKERGGGLIRGKGVDPTVRPLAQRMDGRARVELGDRIVQWGIDQWGNEGEREKNIVAFEAFVNGPQLAMLVGCGVEGAAEEDEAGEEKKGNSENSDQSITCGVEGERCLAEAREWITKKMVAETLKDFAKCVGLAADKSVEEGVECDERGRITKISWRSKNLNGSLSMLGDVMERMPRLQVLDLLGNKLLTGNIGQLNLPVGMQTLNFAGNDGLTGAVDKLVLPEGMQTVNFDGCNGLTGDLAQWHLPVGMKDLNLCRTKVAGAVNKLLLPEGMQSVNFFQCYNLTGDLAQWHLPVGMKDLNLRSTQVTGAVDKLLLPNGMKTMDFSCCKGLTGAVDKIVLPVGIKTVDFSYCNLTGDITQWHLPEGMKRLDLCATKVTGTLPASERAKFDYYGY
jgi:hypothetical protein